MKILITGGKGLVGQALAAHCLALGDEALATTHHELDITDMAQVESVLTQIKPDYVINCAAWTDVDGCEHDPQRAFRENAAGPQNLARACRQNDAGFLTISTDYVFDGTKNGFYTQRDTPRALSVYAESKLAGERLPLTEYARTIVVRTGWIYGPGGRNFLSRVVELAHSGVKLTAIHDTYGTPTYSLDLARRLRELAALDLPGVYHVVNGGEGASYLEFARRAVASAGLSPELIRGVSAADLQRPAARPANSRLSCLWSEKLGLAPLPDMTDAMRRWIEKFAV